MQSARTKVIKAGAENGAELNVVASGTLDLMVVREEGWVLRYSFLRWMLLTTGTITHSGRLLGEGATELVMDGG